MHLDYRIECDSPEITYEQVSLWKRRREYRSCPGSCTSSWQRGWQRTTARWWWGCASTWLRRPNATSHCWASGSLVVSGGCSIWRAHRRWSAHGDHACEPSCSRTAWRAASGLAAGTCHRRWSGDSCGRDAVCRGRPTSRSSGKSAYPLLFFF